MTTLARFNGTLHILTAQEIGALPTIPQEWHKDVAYHVDESGVFVEFQAVPSRGIYEVESVLRDYGHEVRGFLRRTDLSEGLTARV